MAKIINILPKIHFDRIKSFLKEIDWINIIEYFWIFICLLGSGYCFLSIGLDTFFRNILSLIIFVISLILFCFLIDKKNLNLKISKSLFLHNFGFIALLLIGISFAFSFIMNLQTETIKGYFGIAVNIVNGFLISRAMSLKKFSKKYVNVIFYLSLISLFLWIIYTLTKHNIDGMLSFVGTNGKKYYNFLFLSFFCEGSSRMQSIFWEPGLYSSFLLIAMLLMVFFDTKISWFKILVFTISTLLTASTFGILILPLIYILFIKKYSRHKNLYLVFLIIYFAFALITFVFYTPVVNLLSSIAPSIFSKFKPGSDSFKSFTTRIYSFVINFNIFLKHPIFGAGIEGAGTQYLDVITSLPYSAVVDSQTSTSTMFLAQCGVFGLLPTFLLLFAIFKLKNDLVERCLILIIIFVILNKEPHQLIQVDWVFYFLLIKQSIEKSRSNNLSEFSRKNSYLFSLIESKDDFSRVKLNSLLSLIIKGGALVIGFIATPIYNLFFDQNQATYGVWITVLSLLSWIMTFDLGLGNGLKNRLIENDFINNKDSAKELIQTTYSCTAMMSIIFCGILLTLIHTLNVSIFFKDSGINIQTLRVVLSIVVISISLEFTLKNILYIIQAHQKQALASVFSLVSSLSLLLFTLLFRFKVADNQLVSISIIYLVATNLPYIIASVIYFSKITHFFPFTFKKIPSGRIRYLMAIGLGFFYIQICLMIVNSFNSILVSSLYTSSLAPLYNYYSKFFTMIYSFATMVTVPFWAMITKAKHESNYSLIKKLIKRIFVYISIFSLLFIVVFLLLQPLFDIWINDTLLEPIKVNYLIATGFLINYLFLTVISGFTSILNGFSLLKPQVISFTVTAILKVLFIFVLKQINSLSWEIVIYSSSLSLLPPVIILPIVTLKELKHEKSNP